MSVRRARREQRWWDALRSQMALHSARCEPALESLPASAGQAPHVTGVVTHPYYGPTRTAREAVNRLLGFDAAAGQRVWEAELCDVGRLEQAIAALGDLSIDLETRSAIALMLTDRLDRSCASRSVQTELLTRIGWLLRRDTQLQARMRYFWTHMEASGALARALS